VSDFIIQLFYEQAITCVNCCEAW